MTALLPWSKAKRIEDDFSKRFVRIYQTCLTKSGHEWRSGQLMMHNLSKPKLQPRRYWLESAQRNLVEDRQNSWHNGGYYSKIHKSCYWNEGTKRGLWCRKDPVHNKGVWTSYNLAVAISGNQFYFTESIKSAYSTHSYELREAMWKSIFRVEIYRKFALMSSSHFKNQKTSMATSETS